MVISWWCWWIKFRVICLFSVFVVCDRWFLMVMVCCCWRFVFGKIFVLSLVSMLFLLMVLRLMKWIFWWINWWFCFLVKFMVRLMVCWGMIWCMGCWLSGFSLCRRWRCWIWGIRWLIVLVWLLFMWIRLCVVIFLICLIMMILCSCIIVWCWWYCVWWKI